MHWIHKIKLIIHILRWRLTWSRHRLDYRPKRIKNSKFISAREVAELITDHSCVFSNGIAGNARCSIFFYAIRDRFKRSGHPKGLTWINSGAQGSRGRVPGTIEELAFPGLKKRYIAGHLETTKAQLNMAQSGLLALHTLPQGIISLLLVQQAEGKLELKSEVGLHTFLDPRVGKGSIIYDPENLNFVHESEKSLIYNLPAIQVTLINAPYADSLGNIYFKDAATISENLQSIKAVRRNGGLVFVAVSKIIPFEEANISVPSSEVDQIVVNPFNEQTVSVPQRRFWSLFTPSSDHDSRLAAQQLKFINNILRITPVRTKVGLFMARKAANLFVEIAPKGGIVNIGVGFPEEVARVLVDQNLADDYTFTTEAGAYGGLPAPGIFFGAAIHPDRLEPSSIMFNRYHQGLDLAVLGFLEVDSEGNVNVSKRGPSIIDYVGPGGFSDIVYGARQIIFTGTFMHRAQIEIQDDRLRLLKAGKPKFVRRVQEVTFNGKEAMRQKKEIFFVTDLGCFKLTANGVELVSHFPGISVKNDILANSQASIYVSPDRRISDFHPKFENRSNQHRESKDAKTGSIVE